MALGAQRAEDQRNLLVRWSTDADPELQLAASVGLGLLGDDDAMERLNAAAAPRGAQDRVQRMADHLRPGPTSASTRPVSDDPRVVCSSCGRKSVDVEHVIVGANASLCDRCITAVARERRSREVSDPTEACSLCCQTRLEGPQVYRASESTLCAGCIDQSLGLLEREEIDRFLARL